MRRLCQRVVSDKHGGEMWRCGVHSDSIWFHPRHTSHTSHIVILVYPGVRFSCRPMVPKQPALKWAASWAMTKAINWWERWAFRSRCWSACWEKHPLEPWLLRDMLCMIMLYYNISHIYIYHIYYCVFLLAGWSEFTSFCILLVLSCAESCCEICKSKVGRCWKSELGQKIQMEVSWNSCTPKASILMGLSIKEHPFGGSPCDYGNPQIDPNSAQCQWHKTIESRSTCYRALGAFDWKSSRTTQGRAGQIWNI